MFTGIIEALGRVEQIEKGAENISFWLSCAFTRELKIDQSLAHDGVCLTVDRLENDLYRVTAIPETLNRTNLELWETGTIVNLERCMPANGRFDGHMVQGHVDATGICSKIEVHTGNWKIHIQHEASPNRITVEKGSICLNGISLTVVDSAPDSFSVAIIPYTWEQTNLHQLQVGDKVNLEFDIIGKYVARMLGMAKK
jgi:riboflavin synthase